MHRLTDNQLRNVGFRVAFSEAEIYISLNHVSHCVVTCEMSNIPVKILLFACKTRRYRLFNEISGTYCCLN